MTGGEDSTTALTADAQVQQIAHDLNNLLAVMLSHTVFATRGVSGLAPEPTTAVVVDDLDRVRSAIDRATEQVRRLSTLTTPDA